ncbi:hypothetical protein B0H10DRAFT_2228030 [Mycena sp. CBHHK59/15]|nr:hypothetical protein B0H10DRAFT_2228030 [Mycena sp. CBHHK59/15]
MSLTGTRCTLLTTPRAAAHLAASLLPHTLLPHSAHLAASPLPLALCPARTAAHTSAPAALCPATQFLGTPHFTHCSLHHCGSRSPLATPELCRGTRKRDTDKLAQSLTAEKADDNGNPYIEGPKTSCAKAACVKGFPESKPVTFRSPVMAVPSPVPFRRDFLNLHDGTETGRVYLSSSRRNDGRARDGHGAQP